MNKGSCLCKQVSFTVRGPLGEVRYCHCSQCRRLTGSAFSANAKVKFEHFSIEGGESLVKEYEHRAGIYRAFCSNCGSPVYCRVESDPDFVRVRLGSFSNPLGVNITGHVWVSSKADWFNIDDDALACHSEAFEE